MKVRQRKRDFDHRCKTKLGIWPIVPPEGISRMLVTVFTQTVGSRRSLEYERARDKRDVKDGLGENAAP